MTPVELSRNERRELFGTYHTNKKIKNQIDNLMHQMAIIECNLGIDSTTIEKNTAKKEQLILLKKIKALDPLKFDILKKVL